MSIDGTIKCLLPLMPDKWSLNLGMFKCGDVDGDGKLEVYLCSISRGFEVYGQQAKLLWRGKFTPRGYGHESGPGFNVFGDVDGDGRDELLRMLDGLEVYGLDKVTKDYSYEVCPMSMPLNCSDLNGDGCEELIGSDGVLDLRRTIYTPFTYRLGFRKLGMAQGGIVYKDPDSGQLTIACAAILDSQLWLYNSAGLCVYWEDLGDTIMQIAKAHAGGKDHLIMQLSTRILVYP